MKVRVLAFAKAREQFGFSDRDFEVEPGQTPAEVLREYLPEPGVMRVALDGEYVTWDTPIGEARELAVIPPVSGG